MLSRNLLRSLLGPLFLFFLISDFSALLYADSERTPPVLLSTGGGDAYWLLLAPAAGSSELALDGAISRPRGYYLIPREVRFSVQQGASGREVTIVLPPLGGMMSSTGNAAHVVLPSGVEPLSAVFLNGRSNLSMSEKLVDVLRSIGVSDPSAQLNYTDFSDWPRTMQIRKVQLAAFDPKELTQAANSAFAWNKQLRLQVSHGKGIFTPDELDEVRSGWQINLSKIILKMRQQEFQSILPDDVLLSEGGNPPIPFTEAFDRINARLVSVAMDAGRVEFAEMATVLPEAIWRMSLLNQAYAAYYEPTDTLEALANACQALRVRLKHHKEHLPVFHQTYFTADLGTLSIKMAPQEQ